MILVSNRKIIIKQGDITEETSDAIVNAANQQLLHGGGVAGAIVRKGGAVIQQQSREIIRKIGFVPTGKAVITDAGKLPCKFVIHTVGPRMGEGNEDFKLRRSIWSALTLADLYNLKSISMPAVSSGIFGFPKDRCGKILIQTAVDFLSKGNTSLDTVIMCNYDDETYRIFLQEEENFKKKNN